MAVTSGDLDTLGEVLGTDDLWGASRVNPKDFKNNCVSVSTARLENYYTVDDFWQDTIGHPLPDEGLGLYRIISLLRHTGRKYFWKQYTSTAGKSAWENLIADPPTYSALTNSDDNRLAILGLLMYTRPAPPGQKVSGHCINMRFSPGYRRLDGTDVPNSLKLRDFQADDKGEADKADIQQAVKIWAVYDKEPRRPNLFVNSQARTDLKKRERVLLERGIMPLSFWGGIELADQPPPASTWNNDYGLENFSSYKH